MSTLIRAHFNINKRLIVSNFYDVIDGADEI